MPICLIVIITAFAVPTFASSEPSIEKYTLSSEKNSNEDGWVDISVVGDKSTPEYGAYNEWKDYLSDSKPDKAETQISIVKLKMIRS